MTGPKTCPDEKSVAALLAGSLAGAEAEALTAHLEACAACRKTLDRLAGLNDSWPAVAGRLKQGGAAQAPALRPRGHILLQQFGDQTVAEFRKVAIKELPPTPSSPTPFVVLARGERGESEHASLAAAVKAAASGDTVEVRGDGPFVCEPIDLGTKALAIRAGPFARPVLAPRHTPGGDGERLVSTRAPLALEGLTFSAPAGLKGSDDSVARLTFVSSDSSSLLVTHCRFVASGEVIAISVNHPASIELRHSACLGHQWHSLFVNLKGAARIDVADCVAGAVSLFLNPRKQADVALTLERNTLVCHTGAPIDVRYYVPGKRDTPARPFIRAVASGNVLVGDRGPLMFVPQSPKDPATVEQSHAWLKSLVSLQEDGNLHCGRLHVKDSLKGTVVDPMPWDAQRWRTFWGQPQGAFLEGDPQFAGANVERLFAPDSLTPADFRLAKDSPGKGKGDGGRDPGADVDRVGPGLPYERWKGTPEDAEWQKKTQALLDAGKK